MATILYKIEPERLPRYENTVEIGGIVWKCVWRWNNRTRGWYLDVYDLDGVAVLLGERLSVNGRVGFGSVTFSYLLTPAGKDTFASWEDWPDGVMTLYLLE